MLLSQPRQRLAEFLVYLNPMKTVRLDDIEIKMESV